MAWYWFVPLMLVMIPAVGVTLMFTFVLMEWVGDHIPEDWF
jgi:hypothetical protein